MSQAAATKATGYLTKCPMYSRLSSLSSSGRIGEDSLRQMAGLCPFISGKPMDAQAEELVNGTAVRVKLLRLALFHDCCL